MATQAYISAAVYYKNLTTYIFNSSVLESFEGVLLPGQDSPDDPVTGFEEADANRVGVATTKVNGSGGYIRGAELTFSLPLSVFSDTLDGFGFIVSGAVNDSSIDINGVETPVPGLSEEVVNTTVYFEKAGFSARVSNRYRGDFIGEVPEFDSSLTLKNVSAESLLDAQVGYEFQDGFMRGSERECHRHQSHRRAFRAEQRGRSVVQPDQVSGVRGGVLARTDLQVLELNC